MKILAINQLSVSQVNSVIKLDQLCLGGLWTKDGYLREISSSNSYLIGLHIAEEDYLEKSRSMSIIGFACLWSIVNEAHITLLAIHPDYRRQGLGYLMLLSLLTQAIAKNLEWATLEVNTNNSAAINLYQKFGFEIAGTRPGYYQATGEDALILWKKGIQESSFRLSLATWKQKVNNRLSQNAYKLDWPKKTN